MIYKCQCCGKEFTEWRKKDSIQKRPIPRFCSKKCSHYRVLSDITKKKISESVKKYNDNISPEEKQRRIIIRHGDKEFYTERECPICHRHYTTHLCRIKKYCSRDCEHKDKNRYKNCGGCREGSGRSKFGYYKGIYCGSTYELVYVIYRLDHNLPVKRFEGEITDGKLKYIPDFIEDNTIIEIKGYYQESVDKKCDLAKSKGYDIKVLYKKDLEEEFKWVKEHYQYKQLQELYDNYKPKYKYICDCCGKEFETDTKRNTNKLIFCCRECVYHDKHKKNKNKRA